MRSLGARMHEALTSMHFARIALNSSLGFTVSPNGPKSKHGQEEQKPAVCVFIAASFPGPVSRMYYRRRQGYQPSLSSSNSPTPLSPNSGTNLNTRSSTI